MDMMDGDLAVPGAQLLLGGEDRDHIAGQLLAPEAAQSIAEEIAAQFDEMVAEASRIVRMMSMPDEKELCMTAISVGDAVFAGFPGEPFTEVGRRVKGRSLFTLTIPACCANGYEGYYPMQDAFAENGYEAHAARYVGGTAEKLVEAAVEIVNSLK